MNRKDLRPRYWVAFGLGVCSLLVLSLLLMNGEASFRLHFDSEPKVVVSTGAVQPGDTLSTILLHHNIPISSVGHIQTTLGKVFNLRRLRPGDPFEVVMSTDGIFRKFIYHDSDVHSYIVHRSTEGVYSADERQAKTVWIEKQVSGTITTSLYSALRDQGYDERFANILVADLADNIFAWRIDFFTEPRSGDQFKVLLEQEYKLGSDTPLYGGQGRILAAYYEGKATREKENYAFRYIQPDTDKPDYFDEEGKAVRKAFLRAPFSIRSFRISSGFNPKRFHPILRTYRPHHGTDYAAVTGTPVVAVGNGTVVQAGWNGGYGKMVQIRHSNKYQSRYAHLSRIAVKPGQKISQGQYIGRVGSTGRSTGPHLHFEMMVDGVQRDFRRMYFPPAKAVEAKNKSDFFRVRDEYLSRLTQITLASANTSSSAR